MNPEAGTVQTILSVIGKGLAASHVAWSVICTIASCRQGFKNPPGCETKNICGSFIDHTVHNKF
jgi:hypothetical protein